jgi:uncharacterized membrane-anchored protein
VLSRPASASHEGARTSLTIYRRTRSGELRPEPILPPPTPGTVRPRSRARRAISKVPEVTVYFWTIKALSTAMGESTSDFLVHRLHPVPAVVLGLGGFLVALALQLSRRRYSAWPHWFAVVMVGVFGTMAADVLHVGFGVPYFKSAALFALYRARGSRQVLAAASMRHNSIVM